MSILDAQKFSVTCDQCGRKFEKTVREINSNTKITCLGCGRDFDTTQVQADLKKAESLAGLSKTVEDAARKLR